MSLRFLSRFSITFSLVALLIGVNSAWADPPANFMGLGDIPGGAFNSGAFGVSADGATVVGYGTDDTFQPGTNWPRAFRWQNGTMTNLLPNGGCSQARSVSADGTSVAGYNIASASCGSVDHEATLWNGTTNINAPETELYAISGDGTLMAGWRDVFTASHLVTATTFKLTAPNTFQAQSLGLISGTSGGSMAFGMSLDGSSVVGSSTYSGGGSNRQAFRWRQAGGMVGLDPTHQFTSSQANAANFNGDLVIGQAVNATGTQAFLWTQGTGISTLGDLAGGAVNSQAYAIDGFSYSIVGSATTGAGATAFIWDPNNGMRNLQTVLSGFGADLTGWQLTSARGISSDGMVIVGQGINPFGNLEAWRAVLPEPSSGLTLFIVMMIGIARRKY